MGRPTQQTTILAGGVSLAATALVASVSALHFAYVSSATRISMETAQALVAGLVAYLVYGRLQRTQDPRDAILVFALGVSGAGNVLTVVVRAATEDRTSLSPLAIWSGHLIRIVAGVAFVAAASLAADRLRNVRPSGAELVGGIALTVGAITAVIAAVAGTLPETTQAALDISSSHRPHLETSGVLLALHATSVVLFGWAAVRFARRQEADTDPLLRAMAVGMGLAAVAALNFVLYPSLYTNVVHTGDVLRLCYYGVLLVGAEQEIRAYWRDRAHNAVLDERHRIARDLHDGLTQDLTFLRSQLAALRGASPEPEVTDLLSRAADSALVESRRAIDALGTDNGNPDVPFGGQTRGE